MVREETVAPKTHMLIRIELGKEDALPADVFQLSMMISKALWCPKLKVSIAATFYSTRVRYDFVPCRSAVGSFPSKRVFLMTSKDGSKQA